MVLTHGSMEDNILVHGRITICTVMEFILGKMEEDTRVIMRWIKSMAMVCTSGQTGEDTKVIGLMENNMAKENTYCQMEL